MRITEGRVRQIIREELEAMMGPEEFDSRNPSHASAMRRHFSRMERGEDEPKRRSSGLSRFPGMDDDELEPEPIDRRWYDPNADDDEEY